MRAWVSGVLSAMLILRLASPCLAATTPLSITSVTSQNGKVIVRWQGGAGGTNRVQLLCRTNMMEDWRKIGQPTTNASLTNPAPAGSICFFLVTTDVTPPAIPIGLRAITNGCGTALLTWSASTDNAGGSGIKGYRIYRNGACVTQVLASATSSLQAGLSPSTNHVFGLSTVDLAGNESTQALASVTTTACPNMRPVASAGPNQTNLVGVATIFDGSSSLDQDGRINSYSWNFGDGAIRSGANNVIIAHSYTNAGNYAVTLMVTDNSGATASDTAVVTVTAGPTPGQLVSLAQFGTASYSEAGRAVAVDQAGNVFVGGDVNGIFLTKRSPSGIPLWTSPRIGTGSIKAIAPDINGDVFVTGNFSVTADFGCGPLVSAGGTDIFVAKFSSTGACLWSRRAGGGKVSAVPTDDGLGIAVDSRDNSVVVTGYFEDEVDFGGGRFTTLGSDMFLVKFSSEGTHLWSKAVTGGTTRGNGVAIDGSGNIFVTGSFNCTVDFGSGPITTPANAETFLAKYSPAGLNLWVKHFGGWQSFGYAIALDHFGHVFLTGHFDAEMSFGGAILTNAGTMDIFLAKLSAADGSHVWSKRFGAGAPDYGNGLAMDNDGNVFLAGSGRFLADFGGTPLPAATPNDAFVAKFSTDGICRWSKIFGAGYEEGKAVAVNANGHCFVVGNFARTVDFGGGPVTSTGSWDIFLAEFAP